MDRPFEYLELGALETRLPRPTPLEFQTQNGSCRLYFNCIEIYATYFVLYTSTAQNIIEGLRRCQLPLLNAVRTFMVGTFSTSNIQRGAWTPIPILNSRRFSTQFHFSWLELYNIRILRTRIPSPPVLCRKGLSDLFELRSAIFPINCISIVLKCILAFVTCDPSHFGVRREALLLLWVLRLEGSQSIILQSYWIGDAFFEQVPVLCSSPPLNSNYGFEVVPVNCILILFNFVGPILRAFTLPFFRNRRR